MARASVTWNGEEITRERLAGKSLDFIADAMADLPAESRAFGVFEAELDRRRTEASIQAAEAAKASAISQAKSVKWLFLTVLAMFNHFRRPSLSEYLGHEIAYWKNIVIL